MATKLTKPVKRELLARDTRGRLVVVELEPGDTISFRNKGKRTRYEISLHSCRTLAMANYIQQDYQRKMKEWKEKRRLRKPKEPSMAMFVKQIQVALR